VALKIREQCESADSSDADLAAELARDPAMAARILRVASSAAQGAARPVESMQKAVTRLGRDLTRLLVTGFAVEQAFACRSMELRMQLRTVWRQSVEVAALSRALAAHFTRLKPDLAMLAGLTHDIGALALLRVADQHPVPPPPDEMSQVIEQFSARAGQRVLKAWNFPPEIVAVPEQALQFERWHDGAADYADVVSVALLQIDALGARRWWSIERGRVPAFARLGLGAEGQTVDMGAIDEQRDAARELLAA
jgi:HD-like signal output (HDOD) protein